MHVNTPLTPHFSLDEFLPRGWDGSVPLEVRSNLLQLAWDVLEPARAACGHPIRIHSGWRPDERNAAAGGVKSSDHLHGRAADFHVDCADWVRETARIAAWIREHRTGKFGQLIVEDHRAHYKQPGKFWVHVAIPGMKHAGGESDPNRLLYSSAPRSYQKLGNQLEVLLG